jgi:hypothetical protein
MLFGLIPTKNTNLRNISIEQMGHQGVAKGTSSSSYQEGAVA